MHGWLDAWSEQPLEAAAALTDPAATMAIRISYSLNSLGLKWRG